MRFAGTIRPASDFYPRPPRGGRHKSCWATTYWKRFLSTPSARRATPALTTYTTASMYFYPRPPRGGRPGDQVVVGIVEQDFYPRPPRGGRRLRQRPEHLPLRISIHALREEGDTTSTSSKTAAAYFYPRPPRGGRLAYWAKMAAGVKFLSTPSARRATPSRT